MAVGMAVGTVDGIAVGAAVVFILACRSSGTDIIRAIAITTTITIPIMVAVIITAIGTGAVIAAIGVDTVAIGAAIAATGAAATSAGIAGTAVTGRRPLHA